jgi:large subunit ribosomal protein L13
MKTFTATPADIDKKWVLIDAEGVVLGRLASIVAIAAAWQAQGHVHAAHGHGRQRHRHQRRQGADDGAQAHRQDLLLAHRLPGRHQEPHGEQILEGAHPERVVEKAIQRMIPRTRLGRQQMSNLRVYAGAAHPHDAQQPEVVDVKSMNSKNTRS